MIPERIIFVIRGITVLVILKTDRQHFKHDYDDNDDDDNDKDDDNLTSCFVQVARGYLPINTSLPQW